VPQIQGFLVVPYYALVRFGHWDEMLAEPKPSYGSIYTQGVWHYARGLAFAGKGKLDEATQELAELQKIVDDPTLAKLPASSTLNTPDMILRVAPEALAGEIAAKRKDYATALLHLERAVRLEDALVYTEPPDWHYPVRQSLGAVLLDAGRPVEAEAVYWDDLRRNRENGWSLFGLMQALTAQGKKDDAAAVQKRFEKAWTAADVKLQASRF
jgi:tetratricopeptide (TPR) repeat protein